MSQAFISVVIFVGLLAVVPFAVKWFLRHRVSGVNASVASARVVSALAVGPQQRVVTVEVGAGASRTWLVLGVTPQSIHTLHTLTPPADQPVSAATQPALLTGAEAGHA